MNIEKIKEHYDHAREKHPYFCDYIIPEFFNEEEADAELAEFRGILKTRIKVGHVCFLHVLRCELSEIRNAIAHGNTAAAVEECYDAIAVILRVVDVLEGRQPIGERAAEEGGE